MLIGEFSSDNVGAIIIDDLLYSTELMRLIPEPASMILVVLATWAGQVRFFL